MNAAGRVDRSACFEVRLRDLCAGRIDEELWEPVGGGKAGKRENRKAGNGEGGSPRTVSVGPYGLTVEEELETEGMSDEAFERWLRCRARRGLDGASRGALASAIVILDASWMDAWWRRQRPRQLGGDFRTERAPAMRCPGHGATHIGARGSGHKPIGMKDFKPGRRGWWKRVDHREPLPCEDFGLTGNPNKGAAAAKVLGLHEDWHLPVRIERWRGNLPGHFEYWMVCPGVLCRAAAMFEAAGAVVYGRGRPRTVSVGSPRITSVGFDAELARVAMLELARQRWTKGLVRFERPGQVLLSEVHGDWRLPPVSGAGPGWKTRGCPQRVTRLFGVMATEAEEADARAVQGWLAALPLAAGGWSEAKGRAATNLAARLVARYALLFEPRVLLCRRCLGLRYGNKPEVVRRAAQRKLDRRRAKREAADLAKRGPGTFDWVRSVRDAVRPVEAPGRERQDEPRPKRRGA